MRVRELSFIENLGAGNTEPAAAALSSPLSAFAPNIDNAYARLNESFGLSRKGTFDAAMYAVEIGRQWRDKAKEAMNQAENQGLISTQEWNDLNLNVLLPLSKSLNDAWYLAKNRKVSWITDATELFKERMSNSFAEASLLMGQRWEKAVAVYRLITDYITEGESLLTKFSEAAVLPSTSLVLDKFKLALDRVKVAKLQIDAALNRYNVPISALRREAGSLKGPEQQEGRLLNETFLTLAPAYMIGITWGVAAALLDIVLSVFFIILFEIISLIVAAAWLTELSTEEAEAAWRAARTEADRNAAEVSWKLMKEMAEKNRRTAVLLGEKMVDQVPPSVMTKDKFRSEVNERLVERNLSPLWGPGVLPYLAAAAVLVAIGLWFRAPD